MRGRALLLAAGATLVLVGCSTANSSPASGGQGLYASPTPTGSPANLLPPKFLSFDDHATATCKSGAATTKYALSWKADNTYSWAVTVDGKDAAGEKGSDSPPGLTVKLSCSTSSHTVAVKLTSANAQTASKTIKVKISKG